MPGVRHPSTRARGKRRRGRKLRSHSLTIDLAHTPSCDFCHVNHQPCDNGKPKCGVCTKHNKPCLYLRPTKRRGPQKGYRTALNTYKESAAAWGAVLAAIPGLDTLIEGHLRGGAGRSITASVKDSNHQDALITKWQQSSVFRAFFGHNGPPPGLAAAGDASAAAALLSQELDDDDAGDETPPVRPPPASRVPQQPPASQIAHSHAVQTFAVAPPEPKPAPSLGSPFQPRDSLSDIVAKDAAQSYVSPPPFPLKSHADINPQRHPRLPNPRLAGLRPGRDHRRLLHHGLQPGADPGVARRRPRV